MFCRMPKLAVTCPQVGQLEFANTTTCAGVAKHSPSMSLFDSQHVNIQAVLLDCTGNACSHLSGSKLVHTIDHVTGQNSLCVLLPFWRQTAVCVTRAVRTLTEVTVKTALLSVLKSRTDPSENCICKLKVELMGRLRGE